MKNKHIITRTQASKAYHKPISKSKIKTFATIGLAALGLMIVSEAARDLVFWLSIVAMAVYTVLKLVKYR